MRKIAELIGNTSLVKLNRCQNTNGAVLVVSKKSEKVIQEMADISKEADYASSSNIDGLTQLEQLISIEGSR